MSIQEVIQLLESHGWRQTKSGERYRHFKHDSKPGTVTIAGRSELKMPKDAMRSVMLAAEIQETR